MWHRVWKRVKEVLRDSKGVSVSLVEAGAVIAIGTTLAAAVVPVVLDKSDDARIARAISDVQSIKMAIGNFRGDTAEYPARFTINQVATPDGGVTLLRTGDITSSAPDREGVAFGGSEFDPAGKVGLVFDATRVSNINNHLVVDLKSYAPERNWRGPYSEIVRHDPWGNNYIIYARGFYIPATDTTRFFGWVLSAGPNGILETDETSPITLGDDIGVVAASINLGGSQFKVSGNSSQ